MSSDFLRKEKYKLFYLLTYPLDYKILFNMLKEPINLFSFERNYCEWLFLMPRRKIIYFGSRHLIKRKTIRVYKQGFLLSFLMLFRLEKDNNLDLVVIYFRHRHIKLRILR